MGFQKGHTLTKGKNSPRWKGGISKIDKKCQQCNAIFIARKYQVGKYCTRKCYGLWISINRKGENSFSWKGDKIIKECLNCLNKFSARQWEINNKGWGKFCSVSCRAKYSKGEISHNWRGGITPVIKALRNSLEYEEVRKKALERDLYTCQECNKVGGPLEVDHIKQFAYYPELRFELDNLRTLCKPCHRKTESYGFSRKRL